jgi:nicotinamidase-related amidase
VRHEFAGVRGWLVSKLFANGKAIRGSPGCALDQRLAVGAAPVFVKTQADAFSCPEFDSFLVEHRVHELFLTGLDGEYCVAQTAKAALSRGYQVNIVTDCLLVEAAKRTDALLEQFRQQGIRLLTAAACFG